MLVDYCDRNNFIMQPTMLQAVFTFICLFYKGLWHQWNIVENADFVEVFLLSRGTDVAIY